MHLNFRRFLKVIFHVTRYNNGLLADIFASGDMEYLPRRLINWLKNRKRLLITKEKRPFIHDTAQRHLLKRTAPWLSSRADPASLLPRNTPVFITAKSPTLQGFRTEMPAFSSRVGWRVITNRQLCVTGTNNHATNRRTYACVKWLIAK
jgi:hypothetical protein